MPTWNPRANDLFLQALEMRSASVRHEYLDEACAQDAALRAEVESLLEANARAGSFLEAPAAGPVATVDDPLRERPGTIIGPYKLLELIGEGGFGLVFLAEQQQPVRRKVALKVLKPGLDTRQVIARFEAERQALALMDHPNIARVLDAGETASGRPHFVMELVRGVPITDYCDQHRLTTRERLELFAHVCQAVQHAHHKGIIHRDIKPSNVLVTLHDGAPVVKVIDFGIAKALGQQLTDKTVFTGFTQMIGTPLYMSPEQAAQSSVDVDTRSDIYSLGVLLYELLTGTTPFAEVRLQQAGYDEMRRIIREEEPARPSTRINTLGQAATTVAARRQSDPKRLRQLCRGELDWIVMKALEKDRNRRYETASAFAGDVQRYLKDEPVQACPPSAAYRFRKFARRHKAGLAVGGLVLWFLLLLGGGAGWVINDRQAQQALTAQEAETALAEATRLAGERKWPEATAWAQRAEAALASGGGNKALRQRVRDLQADLEAVIRIEEIRLLQSEVKDEAFDSVGTAAAYEAEYHKYGLPILKLDPTEAARRVAASPISGTLIAGLDSWASVAVAALRKHLLTVAQGADNDSWRRQCRDAFLPGDGAALTKLAQRPEALNQKAPTLVLLSDCLAGHDLAAAVVLLKQAQQQYPADFWVNHQLACYLGHMGPAHRKEAIGFFRVALALRPQSAGVYVNLGKALDEGGALEEALDAFKRAIQLKPDYAMPHNNLGIVLSAKGQLDEAMAEFREAIRLKKDFAEAHSDLGNALYAKGQLDEAMAEYRETIRLKKDYAKAHNGLGLALQAKGQLDQAIAAYREAIRLKKDSATAHYNLGLALQAKGQLDEAIAMWREAIRLKKDSADAHNNLGNALRNKGQLDEAIATCREAIRLKKDSADAHNNLGLALQAKGQLDEAIAAYCQAIRLKKDNAEAHNNLGNALSDKGQLDQAIAAYRQAIRFKKDYAEPHNNLGNALYAKGQLDEAIAEFREAIRLKDFPEAHLGLGNALKAKGQLDEAIAEYRQAIRLKKDLAMGHYNLGNALGTKGRLDEAIAEYRQAIRLKKDFAEAHSNLGKALSDKGRLDEAIAEYQEAIRLKKDLAEAHSSLGSALGTKGRLDEAIAEYQEAIRLKKDFPDAHCGLGCALYAKGQLDDAMAAYRQAIRLKKDFAEAHCNLGHALWQQGEFRKALAALRRGHELGSTDQRWLYPSAQWVRQCERLVDLDGRLPDFMADKIKPASAHERIDLAQLCALKRLHRAAARFYEEAFAAPPETAAKLLDAHRYNAACAAALAGTGQGHDAGKLKDEERTRLRKQAVDWLQADLAMHAKRLERANAQDRTMVQRQLEYWQRDDDLSGIRDAAALAKLPAAERAACVQLWADVETLLRKTRGAKKK